MSGLGRYRIHAVAALTGVPEATLRAWERRYAVPVPARTPSGYRLYSPKDVEQVRRMRELCAAGVAPVDAAKMVAEPGKASTTAAVAIDDDPFDTLARRIVDATRRMDPAAIEAEVRLAMVLGDASTVVERAYCPALEAIGRDWEQGIISVGHEHLAAEIVTSATRELLRLASPSRPHGEVLLACFAEEEHVLPVYAAAFRFIEWNYRPLVLGARTPPSALGAAVREIEPALVGLSLTVAPEARRGQQWVDAYGDILRERAWVVGGAGAAGVRSAVEALGGAVVLGTPSEQRDQLGKLLSRGQRAN